MPKSVIIDLVIILPAGATKSLASLYCLYMSLPCIDSLGWSSAYLGYLPALSGAKLDVVFGVELLYVTPGRLLC